MLKLRLHSGAAALAIAAVAGGVFAFDVVGARAQSESASESAGTGADSDAAAKKKKAAAKKSPSAIPEAKAIVAERSPLADATAAAAARAAAAEAAEAEAAEEEEDAEEEAGPAPTATDRAGPSLTGFGASPVAQDPERRIDVIVSQGFGFDTDPGLDEGGSVFSSDTNVSVRYTARGPISTLSISTGAGLRLLAGDGVGEDDDPVVPIPNLAIGYSTALSRTTQLSTGLNVSLRQVAFTEAGELVGFTLDPNTGAILGVFTEGEEGTALQLVAGASAQLSHALNSRNQLSGGISLSRSDYVSGADTLSGVTGGGLSFSWAHQVLPTLSTSISSSFSSSFSEAADDAQSLSFSVTGGANWRASRTTAINGALGPSLTFTERTLAGVTEQETNLGVRAQAGLTYSGRAASASMSFSNTVAPNSDGIAVNVSALSFGLGYTVNTRTSLSGNVGLGWQRPLGDGEGVTESLSLGAGASLSYAITQDVSANLGYGLRWRSEENADAGMSHRVFLTFTRRFTFLP